MFLDGLYITHGIEGRALTIIQRTTEEHSGSEILRPCRAL